MSHRLLSYDDPRLRLHSAEASIDNPLARAAVRILDEALSDPVDNVVSAAALGLPLRIISVRIGEWRHHLFNPVISGARHIRVNWKERSPHTGPVLRNTYRAGEIDLIGTDLAGEKREMTLDGKLAIAAQQAFELLDRADPFAWLTSFQRNWLRASSQQAADRLAGIAKALFDCPHPGGDGAASGPLAFKTMNEVELRGDDAKRPVLARLDVHDPGRPLCPRDMEILAILLGTCRMGHVLIRSPRRMGLAVALLAMLTNLKLSYRLEGWPVQATDMLGLGSVMKPCNGDLIGAETREPRQQFDGIVMELDDPHLAELSGRNPLSGLGKSLSGLNAPLIIAGDARSPAIEDALLAALPFVYQMDSRNGGVIYVCLKDRLSLDTVYGRLLALENVSALGGMIEAASQGWHLLTKSGEREPL